MTEQLTRARLTPFDDGGTNPQQDQVIRFDFNPESLTLKVSSGQQQDRARRGRGQVQSVGASQATLSFDAIFDTTRPRAADDVRADDRDDDQALDVRKRTKPIADLLANAVPGSGQQSNQRAPRRVRFQWGNVIFDGIVTSHQETFDFFSPTGTPLRSKIQLTLTEQNFAYSVEADELAKQSSAAAPTTARGAATAAGQDNLFGASGGLGIGLSASLDLSVSASASIGVSASFAASLGISADVGVSLNAGIDLDAGAAVSVFGASAVVAGSGISGDAGQAGLKLALGGGAPAAPGAKPAPVAWAPNGPPAGSAAAGLAASILAARTAFGSDPAGGGPAAIKGSPPPVLPRASRGDEPVFGGRVAPLAALGGERRPLWESGAIASAATAATALRVRSSHDRGCGCRRCGAGAH